MKAARRIDLRGPIAAIDLRERKVQLILLHCTDAHEGGGGGGAPRHGGLDLERLCTVKVPQSKLRDKKSIGEVAGEVLVRN